MPVAIFFLEADRVICHERENEGQAIVIKYFPFPDLVFLQILHNFPEILVSTKFVVDFDLEFLHFCFNLSL